MIEQSETLQTVMLLHNIDGQIRKSGANEKDKSKKLMFARQALHLTQRTASGGTKISDFTIRQYEKGFLVEKDQFYALLRYYGLPKEYMQPVSFDALTAPELQLLYDLFAFCRERKGCMSEADMYACCSAARIAFCLIPCENAYAEWIIIMGRILGVSDYENNIENIKEKVNERLLISSVSPMRCMEAVCFAMCALRFGNRKAYANILDVLDPVIAKYKTKTMRKEKN